MRTIWGSLLILIIIPVACRKNNNIGNSPVRNDIGYLVSQIIEGNDTTRLQYDDNNKLIGLSYFNGTYNFTNIFESFQYNSNGKLASFKFSYNGSYTVSSVHRFSYQNDTITKTSIHLNTDYGDAMKFILSNDRIIETRLGTVLNGVILSSGFWDTTHYFYQDDNVIKCSYRFLTDTYQPIDTLFYNKNFYNPNLLLEKHIWSLLFAYRLGIANGESKNIPSEITIATYNVASGTLYSSGFFTRKIVAIESAQENTLLPRVIKYRADDGSESITKYFYQKQK